MSRQMTLAARREMFAQSSDAVWWLLVTISHDSLAEPIRAVNDIVPANEQGERVITSRGNIFVCYPFEVDLPGDDGESVSRVTIQIDNVDRKIVKSLRAIKTPPAVTLEVVMAKEPDEVQAGPFELALVACDYDALAVTGDLVMEDWLTAKCPGDFYDPMNYPGLH